MRGRMRGAERTEAGVEAAEAGHPEAVDAQPRAEGVHLGEHVQDENEEVCVARTASLRPATSRN